MAKFRCILSFRCSSSGKGFKMKCSNFKQLKVKGSCVVEGQLQDENVFLDVLAC